MKHGPRPGTRTLAGGPPSRPVVSCAANRTARRRSVKGPAGTRPVGPVHEEVSLGKIAWGRVILGGLVAGVLWWVFEWLVQGVMLGQDWHAAMMALGKTKEQMEAGNIRFFVVITAWCFGAGLFGVWL